MSDIKSFDQLTLRQQKFVDEYITLGNGAEAARNAGYSEKTAKQMATENLSKPYLVAAIDERRAQLMKDTESKVDWLVSQLTDQALNGDNSGSEQIRALEILGKIYGAYAPIQTEVTQYEGTFLADINLDSEDSSELVEEKPINNSKIH